MSLETIRLLLPFGMSSSWVGLVAVGILAPRYRRTRAIAVHGASYLASAFATRLAIEGHQSRTQIACFALSALGIEAIRAWRSGESFDTVFWIVATAATGLGAALARPIAHRYNIGTW